MSTPGDYPPGVPCWVETIQPDPRAALDFYGPLLGWEFSEPGPAAGGVEREYFVARLRGNDVAGIGPQPDSGGPPMAVWSTSICVDSVGAAVERATAAGGALLLGPLDADPAGRLAVLADPAGAAFGVWEPRGRVGAQVVNEPSAWTMSSLHTPDPDGAAGFYGAVFGWVAEPTKTGAATALLRLPGYGGGEPEQPMPRDTVAVMAGTAAGPDGPEIPPHWNVNFLVEDADAVMGRAAELGGAVMLGPIDAPGFRSAVLRDPAGAAFSVTQLTAGDG